MKKIFKASVFIVGILAFVACNNGPLKGYKKITGIFGYQFLSDMDTGTQAGKGVYMIANAIVKTDKDSVLADPNLGRDFTLEIPLRKARAGSDLMKGFQKLSSGDSAVFIMLADTFFSKLNMNVKMPSNVKSGEYVKLYIQVVKLLDSAQYDNWLLEKEIESKAIAHLMFEEYLKVAGITEEPDNNGIIRIMEKQGKGKSPVFGQTVIIDYIMLSMDGQELVNTYTNGQPDEFILGDNEVIKGFNLSLIKMKKGEKSRIILPYYLGYGETGVAGIAPYTHLLIAVELLDYH